MMQERETSVAYEDEEDVAARHSFVLDVIGRRCEVLESMDPQVVCKRSYSFEILVLDE